MSSIGAALGAALSPLRAEASRKNGAKSCGPKTPEGKARSAQNALKHGLRSQKHIVLPGESATEFATLEASLLEELAPQGALQAVLAQRVVAAAWRLERAERLEVELFTENRLAGRSLGHALIRDGNGARSFDTLLRYRSGTLAELWRALRTLKALQAEAASRPHEAGAGALVPEPETHAGTAELELDQSADRTEPCEKPTEPEGRQEPGEMLSPPAADEPQASDRRDTDTDDAASTTDQGTDPREGSRVSTPGETPIKPEARRNPSESASAARLSNLPRAISITPGGEVGPTPRENYR
jgi:hypothetical protein